MAPTGGRAAGKPAIKGENGNPYKRKKKNQPNDVAVDNKIKNRNIYIDLSADDEMECETISI